MDFFTQKAHAKAVERRNVAAVVSAQNRADSLFHFGSRLVRKRHAKDVRRRNSHFLHEIQVTVRQRPRLAGTRASHHAHVAFGRLDRLQLFLVQAGTFPFQGILDCFVFLRGAFHMRLIVNICFTAQKVVFRLKSVKRDSLSSPVFGKKITPTKNHAPNLNMQKT